MEKITYSIIIALSVLLFAPTLSLAHGVEIEYKTEQSYKIVATFDNGKPIAEAQVNVFAPSNPSEPWLQGTTDKDGAFLFTPDFSQQGIWNIQVRKAGHGGMIPVEIHEGEVQATSTGYSTIQLIIMIGAVVWGFIGTALYFRRAK